MFEYSYALEKLFVAVRALATGQKDVRFRLYYAFLAFHPLKEHHFPPELREDWNWIIGQFNKYRLERTRIEERIFTNLSTSNSLKVMRNKTGEKIATKIFDLWWELFTRIKNENE